MSKKEKKYANFQVVLLLLATSAQILKPFLRTPTRVVTTVSILPIFGSLPVSKKNKKKEMLSLDTQVLLVTVLVLAIRQWTEIKEFSLQVILNSSISKLDHLVTFFCCSLRQR